MGGFVQLLKSIKEFENIPIHTFDINLTEKLSSSLNRLSKKQVFFYMENIWTKKTHNKIIKIIKQKGTTLVFCDGGDKKREFNSLAQYIKYDDLIFAHDYARNYEYGKSINYKPEITDSCIEKICIKYDLFQFMYNEFAAALWLCRRKSSNLGIDLQYKNNRIWKKKILNQKKMSSTKIIDCCASVDGQIYGGQKNRVPSIYLSIENNSTIPSLKFLFDTFGFSQTTLSPISNKRLIKDETINLQFLIQKLNNCFFDIRINYFDFKNTLVKQELIKKYDNLTELEKIDICPNLEYLEIANYYYILFGLRSFEKEDLINGSISFNYTINNN